MFWWQLLEGFQNRTKHFSLRASVHIQTSACFLVTQLHFTCIFNGKSIKAVTALTGLLSPLWITLPPPTMHLITDPPCTRSTCVQDFNQPRGPKWTKPGPYLSKRRLLYKGRVWCGSVSVWVFGGISREQIQPGRCESKMRLWRLTCKALTQNP